MTPWRSPASAAIDISTRFNIKKLILRHHDPGHSDKKNDIVFSNAKTYMNMDRKRRSDLDVEIACERMEIEWKRKSPKESHASNAGGTCRLYGATSRAADAFLFSRSKH